MKSKKKQRPILNKSSILLLRMISKKAKIMVRPQQVPRVLVAQTKIQRPRQLKVQANKIVKMEQNH